MLKILIVALLIMEISMENFFSKFHQNDYKLEMQWAELIRYNKAEVNLFKIYTFKYNRTSTALNWTFQYNTDFGNDLEIVIQSYKFASNEYRVFPARFQVNFCAALKSDIAGMNQLLKCGNFSGCPIIKGRHYHMCNWTPDESKFPPFAPSGKYMVELQGLYYSREMWLIKEYYTIFRPVTIQ